MISSEHRANWALVFILALLVLIFLPAHARDEYFIIVGLIYAVVRAVLIVLEDYRGMK